MKRSSITPPTFIATPWMPAGSPKRNSARMTEKSGRNDMERGNCTTSWPENIIQMATPETSVVAMTVPMAAPCVPKAGIGPAPRMNTMFRHMLSTVMMAPRRSGVRASPADRSAPPTMKNIRSPMLNRNIVRRYGSASARTSGVACTSPSSRGASMYPIGASTKTDRTSAVRNAWYTVRLTRS